MAFSPSTRFPMIDLSLARSGRLTPRSPSAEPRSISVPGSSRKREQERLKQREEGWVPLSARPEPIPEYSALEDVYLYRYFMENRNARRLLNSGKLSRLLAAEKARFEREHKVRSFLRPGSMACARPDLPCTPRAPSSASGDLADLARTTRSAPLPQFTHQHHFGWSAPPNPAPAEPAARRDGFALRTCDRIESVRRGILARPTTAQEPERIPITASCSHKLNCSLSML